MNLNTERYKTPFLVPIQDPLLMEWTKEKQEIKMVLEPDRERKGEEGEEESNRREKYTHKN